MTKTTRYLLISELAKQANTTKDTIRHYDELGLLKSRKRQAGSRYYNEYHPQCVERIEVIKGAQAVGFTLKELAENINEYYEGKIEVDTFIKVTKEKLNQAYKQRNNLNMVIDLLENRLKELDKLKQQTPSIPSNTKTHSHLPQSQPEKNINHTE